MMPNLGSWRIGAIIRRFEGLEPRWALRFDVSQRRFFTALVIFLTTGAVHLHAQGLVKVLFPYSVVNYSSLPWMIAKDAGLFRKHGLDVDLVFMGSSALIVQSMISGAVPVAGVAGAGGGSRLLCGGGGLLRGPP